MDLAVCNKRVSFIHSFNKFLDIVTRSVDRPILVIILTLCIWILQRHLIMLHINESLVNWKHMASKEKFYNGLSAG